MITVIEKVAIIPRNGGRYKVNTFKWIQPNQEIANIFMLHRRHLAQDWKNGNSRMPIRIYIGTRLKYTQNWPTDAKTVARIVKARMIVESPLHDIEEEFRKNPIEVKDRDQEIREYYQGFQSPHGM